MKRREFLIKAGMAFLVAPSALTFSSCGKSSSESTPAPANSLSVTSNPDNTGHTHNVAIPFADLTNPPSGGPTYTSDGSHQHQITLSQQQLVDVNNGGSDTVTSTTVLNHNHTWTIKKPA